VVLESSNALLLLEVALSLYGWDKLWMFSKDYDLRRKRRRISCCVSLTIQAVQVPMVLEGEVEERQD
jgi:hypothetical protein